METGMEKDVTLEMKGQEKGSVWKERVESGMAQPGFPLEGQGLSHSKVSEGIRRCCV